MAATGIMPKHTEVSPIAVICTQAVASGAASDGHYELFKVASGMSIVDCYVRMTTAVNATNTYFHVGVASGGEQLISSASLGRVYPQRTEAASKTLPYSCTSDTTIIATLGAAATAASSMIVVATVAPTENID